MRWTAPDRCDRASSSRRACILRHVFGRMRAELRSRTTLDRRYQRHEPGTCSRPTSSAEAAMKSIVLAAVAVASTLALSAVVAVQSPYTVTDTDGQLITLAAGHASLKKWQLPSAPPHPEDNAPTASRVE